MARRSHDQQPFSLFAFQDIITSVTGVIILVSLLLTLELLQRDRSASPTASVVEDSRQSLSDLQSHLSRLKEELEQGQQTASEAAGLSASRLARQESELNHQIASMRQELTKLDVKEKAVTREREHWKARQFNQADDRKKLAELLESASRLEMDLQRLRNTNRVVYNPARTAGKSAWLVDVSAEKLLVAQAGVKRPPQQFSEQNEVQRIASFLAWAKQRNTSGEYFVLLIRPNVVPVYHQLRTALEHLGFDFGFDVIGPDVTVIDPQQGASF